MGKYFGTDGVRGVANSELTPELAFKVGRFGGYVLTKDKQRPKVLIGRDTRISYHMLEGALVAGIFIHWRRSHAPGCHFYTRCILFDKSDGCRGGRHDFRFS